MPIRLRTAHNEFLVRRVMWKLKMTVPSLASTFEFEGRRRGRCCRLEDLFRRSHWSWAARIDMVKKNTWASLAQSLYDIR